MAKFNATGIADLQFSMQEFAEIPDAVVEEMLMAGGEVTVAAHKKTIMAKGLVKTGKLMNSIKAVSKIGGAKDGWKRHVLVSPKGRRGNRNKVSSNVTNAEVGFIHEYGAPKRGIPAKQWMREANETCADDVVSAELAVYDHWMKNKNL